MKKLFITIVCFLSVIGVQQASAQDATGNHEGGVKTYFELDKNVYQPGEEVKVVVYVQNEKTNKDLINHIARPNFEQFPTFDNLNVAVHLRRQNNEPLGGDVKIQVGELDDNLSMVIPFGHRRVYSVFSFKLDDQNGDPLPEGAYVLSHDRVDFFAGTGDMHRIVTFGGEDGFVHEIDRRSFVGEDGFINDTPRSYFDLFEGNLSDHIIFVSESVDGASIDHETLKRIENKIDWTQKIAYRIYKYVRALFRWK